MENAREFSAVTEIQSHSGKKNSRELRDFLAGKEIHHHENDKTQIDLP
jgi:hypothetical protein